MSTQLSIRILTTNQWTILCRTFQRMATISTCSRGSSSHRIWFHRLCPLTKWTHPDMARLITTSLCYQILTDHRWRQMRLVGKSFVTERWRRAQTWWSMVKLRFRTRQTCLQTCCSRKDLTSSSPKQIDIGRRHVAWLSNKRGVRPLCALKRLAQKSLAAL